MSWMSICCGFKYLWVTSYCLLYRALKKEIEQLERGELDSQLPAMWEEVQA